MMKKRLLFFLLLTVANVVLFLFRDRFHYQSYADYKELYGECNEACVGKWNDFTLAYSAKEWAAARQVLSPLRLDTGTTLSKVQRIGRHLYQRFSPQAGFPTDVIHSAAPMAAYKILSADTTQKLFCGTYALMFTFFCWSQDIVCRNVEIFRPGDHHVLSEVYLPEQKQWMMVDLTSNVLSVQKAGRLLNARDLAETLPAASGVQISPAGSDNPVSFANHQNRPAILHYYGRQFPYYYYHATQAETVYTAGNKIKRYFMPESWYVVYDNTGKTNFPFYVRLFLATAWLILGGMIVFKLVQK